MTKVVVDVLKMELRDGSPHWLTVKPKPLTEERKQQIRDKHRAAYRAKQKKSSD